MWHGDQPESTRRERGPLRKTRAWLAAGAASLAVVAAVAVAANGPGGAPVQTRAAAEEIPTLPVNGPMVALGDSYAAGNLIPDSPVGTPAGCLRSTHNYSSDVAAAIGSSSYTDAACSGATTVDMTQSQSTSIGTDPAQFNAIGASDAVVTVTIGGNDVGFSGILTECVKLSITNPFSDPCKKHYTSGGTDQLAAAVAAAAPKVATVLQGVRSRAPQARIVLVGYPDILPNTGDGCFPLVPLAHGDVPYLRGTEQALNSALAGVATANGSTFVDTYTASIGHDVCKAPGTKWIEGLVPTSLAYPFHPNKAGQQGMASAVVAALKG